MANELARAMRKNMTDAERRLWGHLRSKQLGVKFRRQAPIGRFIVDFCSHEIALVIEVDGYDHDYKVEYDEERTAWLEQQGWHVVRVSNTDVMLSTNVVVHQVRSAIDVARREREALFKERSPSAPLTRLRVLDDWLNRYD